MGRYRSVIVKQAQSWLGCNEADGSHKKIIDVYNSHKPWARGYKMPYNVAWCSTYVSACSIAVGYTDIIPTECGCGPHIELFKKLGIWVENDAYVPKPGDIMLYDWEDSGKGDNTGYPNHIGIVEKVENGKITVIEGNYSNAVKRRVLAVNGKYIRGYAVPKYDPEPATESENKTENTTVTSKGESTVMIELYVLRYGSKGEQVKNLQRLLIAKGYKLPEHGADGDFRDETEKAVKAFQKDNGLTEDGIVGQNTWNKLLKG